MVINADLFAHFGQTLFIVDQITFISIPQYLPNKCRILEFLLSESKFF